jgi:hypothetical protein
MNYQELTELVKKTLLKHEPLKAVDLQSPSIDQVAGDVLPENSIRLDVSEEQNPYEADPENNRVIVRGKGVDLPFLGLDSEIQFFFVNGETALTWSATGDAGWNLSTGFPWLERTICDDIPFASAPPPRIVLNSHAQTPGTHQGLFFAGTIDINAMTGGLAGVLGINDLNISGPVILKKNGSILHNIDFTAPDIARINLGIVDEPLTVSFALNNLFIYNTLRERYFVSPYILLSTKIPFKAQGASHSIPVSLRLADLESDQRFSADPTQLIDAGLDEIQSLANNIDLQGVKLPAKFHLEDLLKFKEFFFDFNLPAKKVTLIGVEVESARPWHIFHLEASQQDLVVEDVTLAFRIFNPFGNPATTSLTLGGEVVFGKAGNNPGVLVFQARYPEWSVQGYLKEGTHLSLADALQGFLGSTARVPDLAIYAFDFELSSGNYAIAVKLEGDWNIPFGSSGLAVVIEQIGFSIEHQSGVGTEALAEGLFSIAGFDVRVSAEHPPGSRDGWTFTGSATAEPDSAGISTFLTETIDTLFPSTPPSKSGVPPMLDVAIKTLGADFNTQTKDFHFNTEIDIGNNVDTVLTFSNLHQAGAQPTTFEKRATGVITVFPGAENEFAFNLGIDLKPDSKHFVALYNNTAGNGIKLNDLVKAMVPAADLPSELPDFSITIKDAIVGYVSDKQGNKTVSQSIFALDMGASLDLSSLGNIPLIGKSLSAAKTLKLAFQLVYPAVARGKKFAKADLDALNSLITVAGPSFPADQDLGGLFVKTELRLGDGDPIDFKLPLTINPTTGQLQNNAGDNTFPTPPDAQATDDGVKWLQLNKKFGPVHLQRVGFKFDKGEITALLDGALTALGLEVDLMGLSVRSKITDVKDGKFDPKFDLQGLGLSFSKGGVGFAGALLRLHSTVNGQPVDEYDGLASVEAEGLRLAAIGSLTKANGHTSLFLYAVLDYPLGGTPFFYVTGLAGGFGLNEKLTMPVVDQVSTFPLIAAAFDPPKMPTDAGSAGPFITQEMKNLHQYLTPSIGEYFGCAGIRFTSFELLDTFILVSISFGHEFELDLLGVSTLVVPPQEPDVPCLAKVSLQVVASFIPAQGLAIVQGRLTADSYILDPNCHLTGGFAFATWFGPNPHAGDFVVTLGGYHPDFQKPDHYPTVPRVGVNWQILPRQGVSGGSQLSVTGGLYFALTPRALMAGGAMHAIFQTNLDLGIATVDVKAWFILGADFIVYWKPFHYSAHLYIDIGIDVVIHFLGTHDLGFDAGADLQVWGPSFGGHAHVSVKVIGIKIGFDVNFGASPPAPPPLQWDNDNDSSKSFRKSFLPADDQIVSVAIAGGLVRKVDLESDANKKNVWYVINPKDFCVHTSSVIPVKQFAFGKTSALANVDGNTNFGIASMDKREGQVKTFHQIVVKGPSAESKFVLSPIRSHVPGGLWAEENSADINAELLIKDAVIGFKIAPAKPTVAGHSKSIQRDCLSYTTQPISSAYTDHAIHTFTSTMPNPGNDPAANNHIWTRIQADIHSNTTRDKMLAALGFARTDLDIGEPFATDAPYAPVYGLLSS